MTPRSDAADGPKIVPPAAGVASRIVRRAIDIGVACFLLMLLAPVLAATALAILLESPGGLIRCQQRVGLGGRPFAMLMFRTARGDAEGCDARPTAMGRLIRELGIDELPRLVNVLRGDMGVVGPRPQPPELVERHRRTIPNHDLRHAVRPGLTGWAQVNCPYAAADVDPREELSHDLHYVRHRSLAMDLVTMISTVRVILFQPAAR